MQWGFDFIRLVQSTLGKSDVLSQIMRVFSFFGDAGLIFIVIALVFFFFKETRKTATYLLLMVLLTTIINEGIIKHIVSMPRPINFDPNIRSFAGRWLLKEGTSFLTLFEVPSASSFSFMSGHTTISFAAATIVFYFHRKQGWPLFILAAIIGFSRIYFGVHYPTDVIAGVVFGVFLGFAFGIVIQLLTKRYGKTEEPTGKGYFK